jgi:hypothetical protein
MDTNPDQTYQRTGAIIRICLLTTTLCTLALISGVWMRGCDKAEGHPQASRITVEAAVVSAAQYHYNGTTSLPDPSVTPGAVNPAIVADLSKAPHIANGVEVNICAADFKTGPIRASIRNFPKLKRTACAAYGVAKCDASVEGDHLVSLEIGGCPDCQSNIWPQPMTEARVKEHEVEDTLGGPKGLVCAGKITLQDAQSCVAKDWLACAERIKTLR